MWQRHKVCVIFPAYNEGANITFAVKDFLKTGVIDELLVVDNNSTDQTAKLAEKAGAKIVSEPRQGYGFALRRGLKEASGDLCILAEPDGTFRGLDLLKLLAKSEQFDLVLGTRTDRKFIKKGARMGLFLRWGNILVAKLLQFLFLTPSLSDCGCTLRLIKTGLLKKIRPKLTVGGSHFLPEMVILVKLAGGKMIEIPVSYQKRIGQSTITGSYWKAILVGLRMIFLILSYRIKTLF